MKDTFLFLGFWILIIQQKCMASVTDKEYATMPPIFHQDNYDNCMLLEDKALYCSFEYHLEPIQENAIWRIIQEVSSDPYNYKHDNLRHWICVPLTCPNYKEISVNNTNLSLEEAINECYDKKMAHYSLKGKVQNLKCDTNEGKYPVDWLDKIVLLFFTSYIVIVFLCTFYDLYAKSQLPEEYQMFSNSKIGKILISFSLSKNWYRLKTVAETLEVEYLKPLQGVRFYNTILVILSHTALASTMMPLVNPKYVEQMNTKVANSFLSSGPLCVSTFFFMSAALLTYGIFNQFNTRRMTKSVLVMIFVQRYIRLVPALSVVILFNATWWRHLGNGPNWYQIIGTQYLRCRKNWWTNLLFVNTIIDSNNMCTPTFWYLALDTQYFVLILILLWYLKKYEKQIWYILGTLLCLNIFGTYIQNYINDFEALMIPRAETIYQLKIIVGNPQWHGQMLSAIGNTSGPLLGVGFGYILYKYKNVKLFQTKRLMWKILTYFFSYLLPLGIILIPGWYILTNESDHNPVVASIIAAIGRPVFVGGIAIAIFGCIQQLGGPTQHVLNWPPAYILGRIAYSAYLVHLTIIMSRPGSTRGPVYVSDAYIVYYLLGDLASAYLFGLMLTLFFEMPMSALQNVFIPKHPRENSVIKKDQ
ncbi:unnamed protein product [Psylliodes chrysocephalus]|uniref:Acyltransferase 3 domain-containing protein n=1 Tax=Psylliodes chrysocephalus TaxID=3402493 RepID=A0A9P0G940_9CUCU|nr:unnamed protein product [Psylliodes chrysocephala]